jgi:hypothetical protein
MSVWRVRAARGSAGRPARRWRVVPAQAVLCIAVMAAAAPPVTHARALPEWAVQPPADTAEALWAVGEGPGVEAARRSALRAVAARLRSAVTGRLTDQVSVSGERATRQSTAEVSEEVLRTEFTKTEVTRSANSGNGVVVLLKVDRPALVDDTRSRLAVLAKPIGEVEAALPALPPLEQFVALRRVAEQTEQALVLAQLLQGAGEEAEGRAQAARFATLLERAKQVVGLLVFEVRAAEADTDLAEAVAALLADQGMRAARSGGDAAAVLAVQATSRAAELQGNKMIRLVVRLTVHDAQGRAVASREHQLAGSSRFDHRGARELAVRRWQDELRRAGLLAALGFAP